MASNAYMYLTATENNHQIEQEKGYSALYDFAQGNAKASFCELTLPKEAFLLHTRQHPNCVNADDFKHLDNITYMVAMLWSLYNRLPTQKDILLYKTRAAKMAPEHFHKFLIRHLTSNMKSKIKRVRCVRQKFKGLEQIDCFRSGDNMPGTLGEIGFWVSIHISEPFILWLYGVYCKTLRPVRVHFRKNS